MGRIVLLASLFLAAVPLGCGSPNTSSPTSPSPASPTTGTIAGTITIDLEGTPVVAGAFVIATDEAGHWNSYASSDVSGDFILPDLLPKTYTVCSSWGSCYAGYRTASVVVAETTHVDIKLQCTKAYVSDKDGNTFIMEITHVTPSYRGISTLSLTKAPSDTLERIIWDSILISPYSLEIRQVAQIIMMGEPRSYAYPGYYDVFYFYPITVVSVLGLSEQWYWQGEVLSGYRNSDSGIRTHVDAPLGALTVIRFIHE